MSFLKKNRHEWLPSHSVRFVYCLNHFRWDFRAFSFWYICSSSKELCFKRSSLCSSVWVNCSCSWPAFSLSALLLAAFSPSRSSDSSFRTCLKKKNHKSKEWEMCMFYNLRSCLGTLWMVLYNIWLFQVLLHNKVCFT